MPSNFTNLASSGMPVVGMNYRPPGGNIYWVKKATDLNYAQFYEDRYTEYTDGTFSIYNTIQAAANACTAKRGDRILVCDGTRSGTTSSSKWTEQVYLVKENVSVISLGLGWENQMRPGDAATKYPFTPLAGTAAGGASFFVMARGIEIGGFFFDGGGGYTGVYVGDGYNVPALNALGYTSQNSASAWIHDCYFCGGSEGPYGMVLDGCSANVMVEHNIFERHTVASMYLQPGGSRTVQNPIIRNNEFWAANSSYGIDLYAASTTIGTLIKGNSFRDGSSLVYTYAVRTPTGATGVTSLVGNYFACANKFSMLSTDWQSGNYTGVAGNSATFVSQS